MFIDYNPMGTKNYTSSIKGSSGIKNPFIVYDGKPKAVEKSDLESEDVRIGVSKANITVTY